MFTSALSLSQTRTLTALAIDRTQRLQHFQHILLDSLFKADFLANAFFSTTLIVDAAMPVWGHKCTFDLKTRRWAHPRRPKAHFDASDLVPKWKDHDWATNVQLQKVGIYALGCKKRLPHGESQQKQLTEVASVALP